MIHHSWQDPVMKCIAAARGVVAGASSELGLVKKDAKRKKKLRGVDEG